MCFKAKLALDHDPSIATNIYYSEDWKLTVGNMLRLNWWNSRLPSWDLVQNSFLFYVFCKEEKRTFFLELFMASSEKLLAPYIVTITCDLHYAPYNYPNMSPGRGNHFLLICSWKANEALRQVMFSLFLLFFVFSGNQPLISQYEFEEVERVMWITRTR